LQLPFEFQIGLRYTRAGRRAHRRNGFISFISALSVAGIALGVAALITVLSVMNGFQKEVRDRMLAVLSHIEVFAARAPLADTAPQQASPARDEADEADEAGTLQARIAELEQRIAEFRQQNAVLLPNAAPANPQQIDRVQKQLRDLDARSRSLERRIAADDPQLEEARSWLAMDRERYPPDHPSVLQLEREVANLEQQLETQRWAAREERATLVTQRRELQAQLEQLEQARQSRAAVEREYAALTSELQDAQARLAGIRQQAQAVTREDDRASRHDGPRFMLIAAPARPQAPIRPNRAALLAAGLLAAVAAAMAVMLLLEARNPWVRGPRGVAAVLGEAPLATLPWFGDARGAT